MNSGIQYIKNKILYFSPQNREQRIIQQYLYWANHYRKLSHDELSAVYIKTKESYEYKKKFFSIVSITLLLSFIFKFFESVYGFMIKSIASSFGEKTNENI